MLGAQSGNETIARPGDREITKCPYVVCAYPQCHELGRALKLWNRVKCGALVGRPVTQEFNMPQNKQHSESKQHSGGSKSEDRRSGTSKSSPRGKSETQAENRPAQKKSDDPRSGSSHKK